MSTTNKQGIDLKDRVDFKPNMRKKRIYAIDAAGNRWDFNGVREAARQCIAAGITNDCFSTLHAAISISNNLRANSKTCYGLQFYYCDDEENIKYHRNPEDAYNNPDLFNPQTK